MTPFFYSRFSSFYFFNYFFVGLFVSYWGIYLKSLTFDAFQIGALLSLFQICRIFAPNLLGWISDHSGEYVKWIKITSFFGFAIFTPKPQANENPTRPKSSGVNKDGGS